jgi:hypothetical protein
MKEFICKVEHMTDHELNNFIDHMTSEEKKENIIKLIHHHLCEIKKIYEMLEDVNEDKKAFRNMYLKSHQEH